MTGTHFEKCPVCRGAGRRRHMVCGECYGEGMVEVWDEDEEPTTPTRMDEIKRIAADTVAAMLKPWGMK